VRQPKVRRLLLILFGLGVLVGTLFANLFADRYLPTLAKIAREISDLLAHFAGQANGYFSYLLKVRVIPLLILWGSLFTGYSLECFGVVSAWYGLCTGAVISGAVLLYGAGGIWVFLAMIFPQYLVYGLIFLHLFAKCERGISIGSGRTMQLPEEVSTALLIAVLFLLGILLEAYLNPILLKLAIIVV
jgi:hypothetical protein